MLVVTDTTRAQMHWKGEGDDGLTSNVTSKQSVACDAWFNFDSLLAIAALAGQPVQFHFTMGAAAATDTGGVGSTSSLFSYWVADTECGESSGFTAGGGPGIGGDVDTHGSCGGGKRSAKTDA